MMDRAERRRRAREDEKLLVRGIDPQSSDPEPTAAMARQLYDLIEQARRTSDIDPAVAFLHAKVDATLKGLRNVTIACRKGCAHCCHLWVSATAIEVLFIAKRLRASGARAAIERVGATLRDTGGMDFETRSVRPYPCPMLVDNVCSIYEMRPRTCRLGASANAAACERLIRHGGSDDVPIPMLYIRGRNAYSIALSIALKRARLPYRSYEFSAALARALEREDAERAWLAGEPVFEGVRQDPSDVFSDGAAQYIYERAFS